MEAPFPDFQVMHFLVRHETFGIPSARLYLKDGSPGGRLAYGSGKPYVFLACDPRRPDLGTGFIGTGVKHIVSCPKCRATGWWKRMPDDRPRPAKHLTAEAAMRLVAQKV